MFFRKNSEKKRANNFVKITALLVHAAKIDENFSIEEEKIIKKVLIEIGFSNEETNKLLEQAKLIEENSVQILEFTKEIKEIDSNTRIKIIETLWRIIYSDKKTDMYETSLMRRLEGLLYIDSKTMGSIKQKVREENQ